MPPASHINYPSDKGTYAVLRRRWSWTTAATCGGAGDRRIPRIPEHGPRSPAASEYPASGHRPGGRSQRKVLCLL